MRWARLFADLEDSAADAIAAERDALAAELKDAHWAQLGWQDLLGGQVTLEVAGHGQLQGPAVYAGELILLEHDGRWTAVVPSAVLGVYAGDGRAAPAKQMRRTKTQFARMLRDEAVAIQVTRRDGKVLLGLIENVGQDFVQLQLVNRRLSIPWSAIATLAEG